MKSKIGKANLTRRAQLIENTKKSIRPSNRRSHKRVEPDGLWVTELQGEWLYTTSVTDLSEGGLFVHGRVSNPGNLSVFRMPVRTTGLDQILELPAVAIHVSSANKRLGTGYRFLSLETTQRDSLRSFLRDLH